MPNKAQRKPLAFAEWRGQVDEVLHQLNASLSRSEMNPGLHHSAVEVLETLLYSAQYWMKAARDEGYDAASKHVAEAVEKIQEVHEEALRRDKPTGLYNHAYFNQFLPEFIRRCVTDQRSLDRWPLAALWVLDLDHFKPINDSYGHPLGDKVIARLSWLLRKDIRKGDGFMPFRIGGDEFAVVEQFVRSEHEVYELARRIKSDFRYSDWGSVHEGLKTLVPDVSIGIALLDLDSLWRSDAGPATADQWLYIADKEEMYKAKAERLEHPRLHTYKYANGRLVPTILPDSRRLRVGFER